MHSEPIELKAPVFNVQTLATHDGPGIRTVVFLKGCPLRCNWCANPEGQNPLEELLWKRVRCRNFGNEACGVCEDVCQFGAIRFSHDGDQRIPIIDRKICFRCTAKSCVSACPNKALENIGKQKTVSEIFLETKKDIRYFWNSGGGITLSGGEPLLYPLWASELIDRYKSFSVGTVIETCGYWEWQNVENVVEKAQLVYYDLKTLEDSVHKHTTSVSNDRIVENLVLLSEKMREKVIVSLPIISGVHDTVAQSEKIMNFLITVGLNQIRLLPYHRLGIGKYEQLGRDYPHRHCDYLIAEDTLNKIKNLFSEHGFRIEN